MTSEHLTTEIQTEYSIRIGLLCFMKGEWHLFYGISRHPVEIKIDLEQEKYDPAYQLGLNNITGLDNYD